MGVGKKPDFPPLLAPGRHVLSLSEVKDLCVDGFASHAKREALFKALEDFIHAYVAAQIRCEVWLDGSFLTEKREPDDIDLAVIVEHDVGQKLTDEQRKLIEDTGQPDFMPGLDTFAFIRLSADDPLYGDELVDGAHTWHEQWGLEHSGEWLKGFVVLKMGETDVGLRVCS